MAQKKQHFWQSLPHLLGAIAALIGAVAAIMVAWSQWGTTKTADPGRSQTPGAITAECRDGTYSRSQTRRGACSSHGGVKRWL